jgi:DNA repair photolyase
MVAIIDNEKIAANIKQVLDGPRDKDGKTEHGDFKVAVRTYFQPSNPNGFGHHIQNAVETGTILLDVINPMIESNTKADHLLNERLSTVEALKPYVNFDDATPKETWHTLDKLFSELQPLVAKEVPAEYKQWIEKKVKNVEQGKDDPWNPNAFHITRTDTEVNARLEIPEGVNADDMEKLITAKKPQIMEFMIAQIGRKRPDLADKAKNIEMIVETQNFGGDWKHVNITLRDAAVTEEMKKPGGLAAASAERHAELKNNALTALKMGDGSKEDPAELQKVIARAVFQNVPEVAAKTAHVQDFVAAVTKPLKKLAATPGTPADVVAKINKFVNHELFKDPKEVKKENEEGTFKPQRLGFDKVAGDAAHYTKGLMTVAVTLPKDKLPEILAQLENPGQKVHVETAPVAPPSAAFDQAIKDGLKVASPEAAPIIRGTKEFKPLEKPIPKVPVSAIDSFVKQEEAKLAAGGANVGVAPAR